MRKGLLALIVPGVLLITLVFYIIQVWNRITLLEIILILSVIGIIAFVAIKGINYIKDEKTNQPFEDEMTISYRHKAGHVAYLISVFLWIFLYYIHEKFNEIVALLAVGIIGMAIIYLACLFFIRPK